MLLRAQAYRYGQVSSTCASRLAAALCCFPPILAGVRGSDFGRGLGLGSDGTGYITGFTFSTDFPTKNAYQGKKKATNNS
jgi:hypothetical protein